jgi:sec-independent protein translocase protein TatB
MFNIGTGEIALIAVAALLLLGPKRLPELARGIGKFMREFRRQTDEVRSVVEREFYKMDQELSIHESPESPLIRPADAHPQLASPAPAPELTADTSQVVAGTAPAEAVLPADPHHEGLTPPSEPSTAPLEHGATSNGVDKLT